MSADIGVLLFDLGGVLVDYTGVRDLRRLLPAAASEADISERWGRCPHTESFCLGRSSAREFGERFVREWGIAMAPQLFLEEFGTWSRSLLPGAAELLAALRPRFRLAALSNSNELHWERNTALGITGLFEVAISSHQVGLAKPDPRIYLTALRRLKATPGEVMFFDDLQANVAAALELGIHAFRVEGVEGIRARLSAAGML